MQYEGMFQAEGIEARQECESLNGESEKQQMREKIAEWNDSSWYWYNVYATARSNPAIQVAWARYKYYRALVEDAMR